MPTYQLEGVEVDGVNVKNIWDAFKLFPDIGAKPLLRAGIGRVKADGKAFVDVERWYPLKDMLSALDDILKTVGPAKMFEIGQHVPKNAPFPPTIRDAHSALASIGAAYLMSHRLHGKPMLDMATGNTLEGIGYYKMTSQPGAIPVLIETDCPYPCDLSRGVVSGLVRRFEPGAVVSHYSSQCRKHGRGPCVYDVVW